MRKTGYVARVLLVTFGKKLILLWLIVLLTAFGLSMSLEMARSKLITQSYYMNEDMADLAFMVDSAVEYYDWDQGQRGAAIRKSREEIRTWPGLQAVYEQTQCPGTLEEEEGVTCYGYPRDLLNRLHLPTAQPGVEVYAGGGEPLIWLDNRLSGRYAPGERVSLSLWADWEDGRAAQVDCIVAGFLNGENVHYNFQSGASAGAASADFVVRNPDEYVCVAVSDGIFDGADWDGLKSAAKFLLPQPGQDIALWKELARQSGAGFVSGMEDILQADRQSIYSSTVPILALCAVMMALTVVGLTGTQLQLMNQYRQVAFSLAMSGMTWAAWRGAWLAIFCGPLLAAGAAGAALGAAWESVVMLEGMKWITPLSAAVSVGVVLLCALGILPTVSRWSKIDMNAFRRLSE